MSKVNRSDLDEYIALAFDLTDERAAEIVKGVLFWIKQSAADTGEVDLHEFGTFETSIRKSRTGRNPQTGEPVAIPDKRVVKFKPWKAFRDIVEAGEQD